MDKFVLLISSVFGAGFIKYAPGTFGSFAGLIFWIFIPSLQSVQIIAVLAITVVSIVFSSAAERIHKKTDDGRIVIDEVAGMWTALLLLPKEPIFLLSGFALFRFFDVKKPLFIDKMQRLKSGFGITADDIAAGLITNIILRIFLILNS
jgi:phosphatidylglycerophosphatase A